MSAGDRIPPTLEGAEELLPPDTSLLDLVDNLLDKGLLVHGELVLGLAGVDLVYVGLSAVICASDKILPRKPRLEDPP
ncbi:MAG: gas vesicle protein [Myxococcota bacterium]|nr:gas vesicle protein [Myxococcota bacterium]